MMRSGSPATSMEHPVSHTALEGVKTARCLTPRERVAATKRRECRGGPPDA